MSDPWATEPRTRSAGICTESNSTRPALEKSVVDCLVMLTPASDGSTRKTATPSSVMAGTRNRSASGALSTVIFAPSMRQPSAVFSARVIGCAGSSLYSSARAAVSIFSPAAAALAHSSRCLSEPNSAIAAADPTMDVRNGTAATPRPSSARMLHCSRTPNPSPPTDSGRAAPRTPAEARAFHKMASKRSSAASSSRRRSLVTSSVTTDRVRPDRSCWASVRVNSMIVGPYRFDAGSRRAVIPMMSRCTSLVPPPNVRISEERCIRSMRPRRRAPGEFCLIVAEDPRISISKR